MLPAKWQPLVLTLTMLNLAIPSPVLQFTFLVWCVACSFRNSEILHICQCAVKSALCISRMNIPSLTCLFFGHRNQTHRVLDLNTNRNSKLEETQTWIPHKCFFFLVINSPCNQFVMHDICSGGYLDVIFISFSYFLVIDTSFLFRNTRHN